MKQVCFVLFALLLGACAKDPEPKEAAIPPPVFEFERVEVKNALKEQLTNVKTWNAIYRDLRFGDTLASFYAKRNYRPMWVLNLRKGDRSVLDQLGECRYEGLDRKLYELDTLESLSTQLTTLEYDELYRTMSWLEVKISDHLLSYHRDRVIGRTEPDSIFKSGYTLPRREYPEFDLMGILDNKHYQRMLTWNTHREAEYSRYMDLLKTYYQAIDSGVDWFSIDTSGITKIEPGDTTNIMPAVLAKLYLMGLASEEEVALADSQRYTYNVKSVIDSAQKRFGLLSDGIIGRKTLDLINTSLSDRIEQISATMERMRWFFIDDEAPYIQVNLPGFELELHHPDSIQKMRVCIGKARPPSYDAAYEKYLESGKWWDRPRDFETPQVASKVHYLVVNPTWTVPKSIVTREMYHQMKRDSFYLRENGYGVYYKGKELNPDTINWRKFDPNKLPFTIVQEAGEANALGKVKFIFPNPFQVYLHDTPQRSKFKRSERAVSHGCVRVQEPLELGEFLMINHDDYNSDDFRILMGYEPEDEDRLEEYDPEDSTAEILPLDSTTIIRLNEPVPVYFLYNTVWFDEEGEVQYRRDVYDKNKLIIEAMRQREIFKFYSDDKKAS